VTRLAALVAAAAVVGCGGATAFNLSSHDNDPSKLAAALAVRKLPAAPSPIGGKPRVYMVVSGKPKKLVAFDLDQGKPAWTVDAEIASRIAVGGDFVVALEGSDLVGRDAATGQQRWKHHPDGVFLGVASDATQAYYVTRIDQGKKATWWLTALDGKSGGVRWSEDADGQLGAPIAQGGLVLSPFLTQWLSIVDAQTGAPLTRIRATEHQISFVRATSDAAWFGSPEGVFRLDSRAATGTRKDSTYGSVALPPQLAETTYGPDAYDPVQAGYTAHDRRRILWRGEIGGADGPLRFTGDVVGVHYSRFVFGYGIDGAMKWAYSHPRVELVASAHLGGVIAAVSASGDVIAIDPATGALRHKVTLPQAGGQILGGTFDADGWQPSSEGATSVETVAALVAIARDRDARFDKVKELAVTALAALSGPNVTSDLLSILDDDRAPARLKDAVVDVLIRRKDPAGLNALAVALANEKSDYIDNATAQNVGAIARVIASLAGEKLPDDARTLAVAALVDHLTAPDIDLAELISVIRALAAIGGVDGAAALRTHLLVYRDDEELAGNLDWRKAVVDGLLAAGAPNDREAVRFIAEDPRTAPDLAAYAREAADRSE
jgi:outer membrane protein assembly factor BamB